MKILFSFLILLTFVSLQALGQSNSWERLRGPAVFLAITTASPAPGVIITTTYNGIFRTTDNGATWSQLSTPFDNIKEALVSASDKGTLFLGRNTNQFSQGYNAPFYRSTDSGETWMEVFRPTQCKLIQAVSPDLIYGLILTDISDIHHIIYSTDDGVTWKEKQQNILLRSLTSEYFVSFDDKGLIYLLTNDDDNGTPIIRCSHDTGETYNTVSIFPYDSAHNYQQPSYVVSVKNDSNWYMTISGVPSVSHDMGISWAPIQGLTQYLRKGDEPRFVLSRKKDVLLLTSIGKLIVFGEDDKVVKVLESFSDPSTHLDINSEGHVYINTYLGLYGISSQNDTLKYLGVPSSSPKFVCFDAKSKLFVYNSITDDYEGPQHNFYGYLSYSIDNYQSLSYIMRYYYGAGIWDHLSCFVIDTITNTLVIGLGEGVVATGKDGGQNWEAVLGNYKVKDFQVYISGSGLYYAYSPSYALKLSKNQGSSWSEITYWDPSMKSHRSDGFNSVLESSHGITFAGVYNKLYRKPSSDSVFVELANITLTDKVRLLYETSLGDIFVITENNLIYISQDGGNTFVPFMAGMQSTNVTCIEEIGNGVVVVGVGNSMYFRRKTDSYWTPFPIPGNLGEVISIAYKSNFGLYVGSRGNGLWLCKNISDTITSSVGMSKTSNFDAYVAPNPIVPSSSIFIVNEKDTKVTLSVIDVNGKSLSTPLLFNYSAFTNTVPVSDIVKKLPSAGQYYVSITSDYGNKIIPILIK